MFALPMEGDRKPMPVLRTDFNEGQAQFSPDGRWIAHLSDESGSPEIYVRPFAAQNSGEGAKWMISKGGGARPRWRADGKELLYTDPGGGQMTVEITLREKSVEAGTPHRLFSAPGVPTADLTADAKRFLYASFEGANAPTPFTIVLNWQAGLKK
jgi:serine/threonine-protein kinase